MARSKPSMHQEFVLNVPRKMLKQLSGGANNLELSEYSYKQIFRGFVESIERKNPPYNVSFHFNDRKAVLQCETSHRSNREGFLWTKDFEVFLFGLKFKRLNIFKRLYNKAIRKPINRKHEYLLENGDARKVYTWLAENVTYDEFAVYTKYKTVTILYLYNPEHVTQFKLNFPDLFD